MKLKFNVETDTQYQRDLFNQIEVGDIVWCKMYLSLKRMLKIEYSHRNRLYLIVSKKKDKLIVYALTSNPKRVNNPEKYYKLQKSEIEGFVCYFDVFEINKFQLQRVLTHISGVDAALLNKSIQMYRGKNHPIISNIPKVEKGNVIIEDNKYYYVYEKTNNSYQLVNLTEGN